MPLICVSVVDGLQTGRKAEMVLKAYLHAVVEQFICRHAQLSPLYILQRMPCHEMNFKAFVVDWTHNPLPLSASVMQIVDAFH